MQRVAKINNQFYLENIVTSYYLSTIKSISSFLFLTNTKIYYYETSTGIKQRNV